MAIVLPHGVLFRPGDEADIRKNLIDRNKIEAIIGLPSEIFFGTPIATIVMILKANRDNTDVLFIDASKYASKDGKQKKLRASDIKRIFDAVISRPKEIEKFARLVSKEEIRANDYDLNIPKYVDSSDELEQWDLYSLMLGGVPRAEIEALKNYWEVMPQLRADLFEAKEYAHCKTDDISSLIRNHKDVESFNKKYERYFTDYEQFLTGRLIDKMLEINTAKEIDILGDDLFARLKDIPLLDRYAAFQALSDCWEQTSTDLEIIQTEGQDALKKVEPNMVPVKNDDEADEVQKGWRGRIMPFELVQKLYLKEYLEKVESLQAQLAEVVAEVESLKEEITKEDADIVNEDGDAFDSKKIKTQLKLLLKEHKKRNVNDLPDFDEGTMEAHVVALTLNAEKQKALKAEIKEALFDIEQKTIYTIESLTEEQIRELLRHKWVLPVVNAVKDEQNKVISNLIDRVETLVNKYSSTLNDVENDIAESESKLSGMIDSLRGNEYDMIALESLQKLFDHGK